MTTAGPRPEQDALIECFRKCCPGVFCVCTSYCMCRCAGCDCHPSRGAAIPLAEQVLRMYLKADAKTAPQILTGCAAWLSAQKARVAP